MNQATRPAPLVSIVIPAYRADHLDEALNSVLQQTYRPLELVIGDDSRGSDVQALVDAFAEQADFPIRYLRNAPSLGELRNTAQGIARASGHYIKFLHDDDRLHPDCIGDLVAVMEAHPTLTLATSRRTRIDEFGTPLPDVLATAFPFEQDVVIHGGELVSFLAEKLINFIGEPSTALCRRSDVLEFGDGLSTLNGLLIEWVGDLAMYAKLLSKGDLAMLAKPLAEYRVSSNQYSQAGRDNPAIASAHHRDFQKALRDLGWYKGLKGQVRVAPITRFKKLVFKTCDLLAAIQRSAGRGGVAIDAWLAARQPQRHEQALIDARLGCYDGGPKIAVLILVGEDQQAVQRTLISLQTTNLYRNAEAQLVDAHPSVRLESIATANPAVALNQAVRATDADWFMVVRAGTEFTASGLLIAALDLLEAPESCLAVFADELSRSADGELGLVLRPDFNLDLLLSFPASISSHWLFRRAVFDGLGGFDESYSDCFELDLQLRLIESHGTTCIGHVSEPLLIAEQAVPGSRPEEQAALSRHLNARGYGQHRLGSRYPGRYAIEYGHADSPSVSIIIAVEGQLAQVQHGLQTLLEKTAYGRYEVLLLVDGKQEPATEAWLAAIEGLANPRLRLLRFAAGVGPATIRNQAASQASGDFLLWLSATASVFDQDWLVQLLNHGLRPEVGAVGAKLIAADGTVDQAGLLLGRHGSVGKAFEGAKLDDSGYLGRLVVEQNCSALSAACLLVRTQFFRELGGFDEDAAMARWIDVDLCLRLQQAGLLNVWTPRVQLLVGESTTARPSTEEEDALYERWLPLLARDPASNPNLSLTAEQSFALEPRSLNWQPLQSWRPMPTVLVHPADLYGCGHYRVIQPFNALKEHGAIVGMQSMGPLDLPTLERYRPDVIVLQRMVGEEKVEHIRRLNRFSSAFKLFELDDYLPGVPMKSVHRQHFAPNDMNRHLRRALGNVDRLVVSTDRLGEALNHLNGDVRIAKNCLDPLWWRGLSSRRRRSAKPRVGWAGGSSHTGDLETIADVVRELADEVEWVFFGMCPEKLRPYISEFHSGVPIAQYPAKLASLDLDLALAPVEQNLFNECKSNLRLLEYGICGFPVIASDVYCYQGDLPVTRVKNRHADWLNAIRMHLADLDAAARQGDALKLAVERDYMLEGDNLQTWMKAWLPDAH